MQTGELISNIFKTLINEVLLENTTLSVLKVKDIF